MDVHIGKEIEKVYRQSGMKLSEFAKRINTSSRNIYSIFDRREIKTDQLHNISEVLGFDFFSFYQSNSKQLLAEEPERAYKGVSDSITISLRLDGAQSTLDRHIKRIIAINRLIVENK